MSQLNALGNIFLDALELTGRSNWLGQRFLRDQIAAGADVVVIQAGTNDATAAVFQPQPLREETIARAARAVIAIGEDARRAGASQVIILTIVPPAGWPRRRRRDRPWSTPTARRPRRQTDRSAG